MAEMVCVDTNVLVYSLFENSKHHVAAKQVLQRAQTGEFILGIAPQVLAECYAVITDSRRVTTPYTAEEAIKTIELFLTMPGAVVLPVPLESVPHLLEELKRHSLTGIQAFNAQLVVVMFDNGIRSIFTFDDSAYEPFEGINVLAP